MKEFIQLERGRDREGTGLGWDLRLQRAGPCFHDVREAELTLPQVQGGSSPWLQLPIKRLPACRKVRMLPPVSLFLRWELKMAFISWGLL